MSKAEKPSAEVTICNRKGLHARASAKFVKCAETFDATIRVMRDGQSVGGTSIMGLMMLAAGPGGRTRGSRSDRGPRRPGRVRFRRGELREGRPAPQRESA